MSHLPPEGSALVLVDVQRGFRDPVWGPRNNPGAEEAAGRLLQRWRQRGWPVLHVRHDSATPGSPLLPGQPGHDLADEVTPLPGEPVLGKTVNSAFIGTDLEQRLRRLCVPAVAVAGITTDHCVSTTTRMGANLGWQMWLVADACATFDRHSYDGTSYGAEQVHQLSLASLHGEFATVVTTTDLLRG